jgi:dTDP-glucose pyrophosphorylase
MYTALIPCAGFGTRMRMKPHEAKELLPDETGSPTIEWSLNICRKNNIKPVVVSRKEKNELNLYLEKNKIEYVLDEGKSTGSSLLKTKKHWTEYNIVILPDTRFDYPSNFFNNFLRSMKLGNDCVFALFEVEDYFNWGVICDNTFYEKPKKIFTKNDFAMAWGVFGFTKKYGQTLLSKYNLSSEPLRLKNPGYFFIENFRDISRRYTNDI